MLIMMSLLFISDRLPHIVSYLFIHLWGGVRIQKIRQSENEIRLLVPKEDLDLDYSGLRLYFWTSGPDLIFELANPVV